MTEADKSHYSELDPGNPLVMNKVLHLALHYLRNTKSNDLSIAEDIRQNVLKALLIADRTAENPEAYLSVMVRNEVFRYLKKTNHVDVDIDEADNAEFDRYFAVQPTQQSDSEAKVLLSEIWKNLDEDNRHILNFLIFGYTQKEISVILNITHEAARQRVSRLKIKIKDLVFSHQNAS